MSCEHNFVTLEGDDWLCHDCEIYFPKHPVDMEAVAAAQEDDERWHKVNEIFKKYEKSFVEHINKNWQVADEQKLAMELYNQGRISHESLLEKFNV